MASDIPKSLILLLIDKSTLANIFANVYLDYSKNVTSTH